VVVDDHREGGADHRRSVHRNARQPRAHLNIEHCDQPP
jgi:hypothetical protein